MQLIYLLYVRAESAVTLTRELRDAPWAPRIRRLVVRVPPPSPDAGGGGRSEDPVLAGPRVEALADLMRVLPGLRQLYVAPLPWGYVVIPSYMEDMLALDELGFCGVNT
ncbi:hypothetical protein DL771_003198 [Monosporascus sp. 5C6A]|nr:hypothetical protein DL771_003198 [Monosporascus sp. 5C6A]